MADRGGGGFRKETADRLLRLHFRDGRTRVQGDAQLLMAEMLNVFVRAPEPGSAHPGPAPRPPSLLPYACTAEAAARAARQAQAEDLQKVDIEHLEKVLPQLLLDF
ncbi:centromere protein X isoform X2 [Tyto alba]|uniref:centromere protein X isoform X2 n=1 Tax=Tyto alba TaxID=56313 RepID=UPI001C6741DC|nr:centromere protein X isoform X2 [Tyto alba]